MYIEHNKFIVIKIKYETWIAKQFIATYVRNLSYKTTCFGLQRPKHVVLYVEINCQLDATEVFIADLIACSTYFGHHYVHHQELKSIIQWLLRVLFCAVVFKLLVWCGAEGYVSGLQDAGLLALSSTPDQLFEKPQHKIPQAATTV